MPISKELQAKIDVIKEKAKNCKVSTINPGPPVETSLSKAIRSQKDADEFMRLLRALR